VGLLPEILRITCIHKHTHTHTNTHTPQLRSLVIGVKIKLLELKYVNREHPSAQYSQVKTALPTTGNSRNI